MTLLLRDPERAGRAPAPSAARGPPPEAPRLPDVRRAARAPSQDWCLECGDGRARPPGRGAPGMRAAATVVALTLLLVGGAVAAELRRAQRRPTPSPPAQPPRRQPADAVARRAAPAPGRPTDGHAPAPAADHGRARRRRGLPPRRKPPAPPRPRRRPTPAPIAGAGTGAVDARPSSTQHRQRRRRATAHDHDDDARRAARPSRSTLGRPAPPPSTTRTQRDDRQRATPPKAIDGDPTRRSRSPSPPAASRSAGRPASSTSARPQDVARARAARPRRPGFKVEIYATDSRRAAARHPRHALGAPQEHHRDVGTAVGGKEQSIVTLGVRRRHASTATSCCGSPAPPKDGPTVRVSELKLLG